MNQSHQNSSGAGSGSYKSYTFGFIVSIVLTVIPFMAVMSGTLSHAAILACIFFAGLLQIFVQLHFFLHLDRSSAMHWNLMTLLFTFFIIFLFVGGSIWIMHSLHYRL